VKETAPNFRDGICCASCLYYKGDHDGEGECKKYITHPSSPTFSTYSQWSSLCDGWEKDGEVDK
jgi:hypothetical protein